MGTLIQKRLFAMLAGKAQVTIIINVDYMEKINEHAYNKYYCDQQLKDG